MKRPATPPSAAAAHPSAGTAQASPAPPAQASVASTLWAPGDPSWSDVEVIDPRKHAWLSQLIRVYAAAGRHDVLVLNGASRFHDRYRDLVAGLLVARTPRHAAVVYAETAWDLGSARLAPGENRSLRFAGLARMVVRALDGPRVSYCVFSEAERNALSEAFDIDRERITVTRFGHTLWSRADVLPARGDLILAAGDALRDYDTLLAAVRGLDAPVRIVTHEQLGPLPPNVSAGPVEPDAYHDVLAHAGVVVVPLHQARRSAGLITYLNAMALGKPVIVSDTTGAREYVRHRETGLLVAPGDAGALRMAIEWLLDPVNAEEVGQICARARAETLAQRPPTSYWRALRDAAERAAGRVAKARGGAR